MTWRGLSDAPTWHIPRTQARRNLMRTHKIVNIYESTIDSEIIMSSLPKIDVVLCVANDIQNDIPRVTFLCIHHFP